MPKSNKNITNTSHKKHLDQLDSMFDETNQNKASDSFLIIIGICISIVFFVGLITVFVMNVL